jgi:hypothetical protein
MAEKRSQDFLEPLSGRIKRKKFVVVDIESKDGDTQVAGFTRPFLIGAYDPKRKHYEEFRDEKHLLSRDWKQRGLAPGGCIDKTMQYLLSSHHFVNHNIYAHNGGGFDHLFWLRWLRMHDDEYGFEIVPVQSSIQALKVWRLPEREDDPIRDRWTFLDSFKLFPAALDKMLKTFKLGGKVQHNLHLNELDPSWSVYLKQDCVGLAKALDIFHDLVENKLGGEVGMTAPSTSMKLFRRRFLGAKRNGVKRIPRHMHWDDCERGACTGCAHEWARLGYYGGRTELFRTFGENLHYYDINSSYVAAMRETMPIGDRVVEDHLNWDRYKDYAGFVECTVHIPPDCKLPPLPFRADTGKLIFPAGTFSGVWSAEELRLLDEPLVKGRIIHVKKAVWFRRQSVFVEMVDTLWGLRQKCLTGCKTPGCQGCNPEFDEGLSALAKLMGNSLYGKFGMKTERTSIVFSDHKSADKCFLCQEPAAGGLCDECEGSKPAMPDHSCDVWYQHKTVEAPYIIPHIAAHITSLARVRIWRFMKQAIEAGGEIYYTDTDSIITDAILPSSQELGALKDEYPGQELTGRFVQPKVYMLESPAFEKPKVTMKGFPKSLRTKENLAKLEAGEVVSYMNLEKVRTLASLGFRRGPLMREVKKSFKSKYDKRIINPDGVTTRAVVLDPVAEQNPPDLDPWEVDGEHSDHDYSPDDERNLPF